MDRFLLSSCGQTAYSCRQAGVCAPRLLRLCVQVSPRTWRHLALVMDAADDTVRFYVDGAMRRAGRGCGRRGRARAGVLAVVWARVCGLTGWDCDDLEGGGEESV